MTEEILRPDDVAWRIVNDGVMGGLSSSRITRTDRGTWIFAGDLSLENNGGFASVRCDLARRDLSDYAGLALRVRGDGRAYRLRLRTNDRFDGVAYQAGFTTIEAEWTNVRIPFADFAPSYRGRAAPEAGPLDTAEICQLGLMIADGEQAGFSLEVMWIRALRNAADEG